VAWFGGFSLVSLAWLPIWFSASPLSYSCYNVSVVCSYRCVSFFCFGFGRFFGFPCSLWRCCAGLGSAIATGALWVPGVGRLRCWGRFGLSLFFCWSAWVVGVFGGQWSLWVWSFGFCPSVFPVRVVGRCWCQWFVGGVAVVRGLSSRCSAFSVFFRWWVGFLGFRRFRPGSGSAGAVVFASGCVATGLGWGFLVCLGVGQCWWVGGFLVVGGASGGGSSVVFVLVFLAAKKPLWLGRFFN
jgi:hypothetical protein